MAAPSKDPEDYRGEGRWPRWLAFRRCAWAALALAVLLALSGCVRLFFAPLADEPSGVAAGERAASHLFVAGGVTLALCIALALWSGREYRRGR